MIDDNGVAAASGDVMVAWFTKQDTKIVLVLAKMT